MAAKPQKRDDSKKRKHAPAAAGGKSTPKKLKSSTGVPAKVLKKPHNKFSKPGDKKQQPKPHVGNDPVDTKRQRRIQAKVRCFCCETFIFMSPRFAFFRSFVKVLAMGAGGKCKWRKD